MKQPKKEFLQLAKKRANEDDPDWWDDDKIKRLALALEDNALDNEFRKNSDNFEWSI